MYVYYKPSVSYRRTVNLLLVQNEQTIHYILIKSVEVLLRSKTKRNRTALTCKECFQRFQSERMFEKHSEACKSESGQIYEMPEDNILKFKNWSFRFPNVLTVYAGTYFQIISILTV